MLSFKGLRNKIIIMSNTVYSGIKHVEYTSDPLLAESLVPFSHGAVVEPLASFQDICVPVPGDMRIESRQENGETIYTTTLAFKTEEDVPTNRALCFRAIDKIGRSFLIGVGEQPHPVVTVVDDNPADPQAPRVKHVTVTWTSKIGYLLCAT